MSAPTKTTSKERRQFSVRNRVRQSVLKTGRVRLSVHRTSKHIYAQVIDDVNGNTLAAASTIDKEFKGQLKTGATVEAAQKVGALVATRAKEKGVSQVVFDRGQFLFHGRIKALADAARESGLDF
ncbi:MAG: ribosomal protein [Alphaproteobacteria bacterium]|nr:ribosomal protein [Alphaproteobacteria bacterium]